MVISEEFQVHDTLNQKLFDDAGKLLPDVKQKIVEIVAEFENELDVPIYILDIQLVGSNASYNYTDTSDLDVHIIANFADVDKNIEVVKAVYDLEKAAFNKAYDISIKGIDVELYVEDCRSLTESNGIYSVCQDEWIKEPKPIKHISIKDTSKELEKWTYHINNIIQSNIDGDAAKDALNTLYLMRHNSLSVDGEYGAGNQLFKNIRSSGLLDALKDYIKEKRSKELSMEGFSKGQLVNRME